jgi:hypothetical protein
MLAAIISGKIFVININFGGAILKKTIYDISPSTWSWEF